MDPICPLLTIGGDARAVSAAPDPAHRCAAGETLTPIERDYQARFCLTGRHETCERFVAHLEQVGPVGPTWRPAAPDATFTSTRIVVESAPRAVIGRRSRPLGMAVLIVGGLLLLGILIGWIALGGLGAILPPPDGSPSATPSVEASPSASTSGSASPEASASPTPAASIGPTPTPAPTPVTYIVQSGDTLNLIANRYGTTAQAIMAANGLTSDIIQVGQVLIIPAP